MARKNISNYKLTSWSHLKLKFTVHFLKSPEQTGLVSISTFWETFSTFHTSMSVTGTLAGWTLCNSYSSKTPPASSIGNLTLRTRCQSSKVPTALLFLYLVDFGTALSTRSSSSSIVFGRGTFLRPWQKLTKCKSPQVHNAFGIQIGATRNYWIIKNKSSQIQWMPTEYKKSHIQSILKKNGKNTTLYNFVLFLWRSHFRNSCIVFHHDFQTLKNDKSTRPKWPRAFIWFLVFGNRDETLALVFEIVQTIEC